MPSYTVRYFHKVRQTESGDEFYALACTKAEANRELNRQDLEWCPQCKVAVESEGRLDRQGIYGVCPFCGETTQETV